MILKNSLELMELSSMNEISFLLCMFKRKYVIYSRNYVINLDLLLGFVKFKYSVGCSFLMRS